MDNLDRERLTELYVDRDEAQPSFHADAEASVIRDQHVVVVEDREWFDQCLRKAARRAYWKGRIDEYAAQNAITDGELALCEAEAKGS